MFSFKSGLEKLLGRFNSEENISERFGIIAKNWQYEEIKENFECVPTTEGTHVICDGKTLVERFGEYIHNVGKIPAKVIFQGTKDEANQAMRGDLAHYYSERLGNFMIAVGIVGAVATANVLLQSKAEETGLTYLAWCISGFLSFFLLLYAGGKTESEIITRHYIYHTEKWAVDGVGN